MKQYIAFIAIFILMFMTAKTSFAEGPQTYGKFDLKAAIDSLPESSDKPYADARLLDNGYVGVRVFRVFHPVPRHHHDYSSTYLNIQSGRALLSIEGGEPFEAGAGDMVFWERGVDHEIIRILEHPFTALAVDTPTRRKDDVQRYTGSP